MATKFYFTLEEPFNGFMNRYRELTSEKNKRRHIFGLLKLKADMILKMGDNDLRDYVVLGYDDELRKKFIEDMVVNKESFVDGYEMTAEELDGAVRTIAFVCNGWYALLDEIKNSIEFLNGH